LTVEAFLGECDGDGDGRVSRSEWDRGKPGWEWLFPIIDSNGDSLIVPSEYAAFQEFKARNPNWQDRRPRP
jgi:hypothetical protein